MELTKKQEIFCEEYRLLKTYKEALEKSGIKGVGYGSKYYVYFLVNPFTDEIFYIGKGKNNRANNHLAENKRGDINNPEKHLIISDIIKQGGVPRIVVFKNELEEKDALKLERGLIKRLKAYLTNLINGCKSLEEKRIEWAKSCLKKAVPYDIWLKLKPRSENEKQMYQEIKSQLEKVASGEDKLYSTISITNTNKVTYR